MATRPSPARETHGIRRELIQAVQPERRWWALLSLATFLGTAGLTASSPDQPVGDWKLRVNWPSGPADVVLTVAEKDGALTATWTGPRGRLTAADVTFADAVLRFVLEPQDQNGSRVKLRFEGRVADGKIDGYLLPPRGARIKVTGKRKA